MLDNEDIDAFYSVVPAYARTDVEATAATKGIHIFQREAAGTDDGGRPQNR